MHRKIIALLLSALVLPGLGQLYLGWRKKGAVLLVLSNCFLLAAIFLILPGLGTLLVAAKVGQTEGTSLIATWLIEHGSAGKGLLAAFLGIWGYAVIDILTGKQEAIPPKI
jgi:TM2 domain-containing membrane protein YozV